MVLNYRRHVAGLGFFFCFLSGVLAAQQTSTLRIEGLDQPVEILKDKWGISHIYAQTEHDLFFAQDSGKIGQCFRGFAFTALQGSDDALQGPQRVHPRKPEFVHIGCNGLRQADIARNGQCPRPRFHTRLAWAVGPR